MFYCNNAESNPTNSSQSEIVVHSVQHQGLVAELKDVTTLRAPFPAQLPILQYIVSVHFCETDLEYKENETQSHHETEIFSHAD